MLGSASPSARSLHATTVMAAPATAISAVAAKRPDAMRTVVRSPRPDIGAIISPLLGAHKGVRPRPRDGGGFPSPLPQPVDGAAGQVGEGRPQAVQPQLLQLTEGGLDEGAGRSLDALQGPALDDQALHLAHVFVGQRPLQEVPEPGPEALVLRSVDEGQGDHTLADVL